MALNVQLCPAAAEVSPWKYFNVEKLSDSVQYSLSIDSKGLPHMVLLSQSGNGNSFIYEFWSNTGWTKSMIQPVGSYITHFSMFLDSLDSPHVYFIESRFNENKDCLLSGSLYNGTWIFKPVAKHARISNLQVVPCSNGSIAMIYDFSENPRYDGHTTLAVLRTKGETIEEKPILLEDDPPIDRFLTMDSQKNMLIAYTKKTTDGYQEIQLLNYDGDQEIVKSIAKGSYHYFTPINISHSSAPYIYAYNFDQESIERFCISTDKIDRAFIPDTKDGQLPYTAIDSIDQAHIAYVDFRKLAYRKQELRYLLQRGDLWEQQTVDYGMNANIALCLDAQDNVHLLYQVGEQLKYATTSTAIVNPGKAAGKPESPDPDLVFEKLPIKPQAALVLVKSLKQVKKDAKWAERLELENYPTVANPFYHIHQYTVIQDDATSGHTATAGWYDVNAYTGQITDDEGKTLKKGTKKK